MRVSRSAAVISVLSSIGLVATAALPLGQAQAAPSLAHWSQRTLVVSDRTGDPGWELATRRGVDVWNAAGAAVHLTSSQGGIGCEPEGTTIPVCRDVLRRGWQAATALYTGPDGHLGGARIRVDAGRRFSQAQRDGILCHEIGHALGLDHSDVDSSCLTQGSRSTTPSVADVENLRMTYGHRG